MFSDRRQMHAQILPEQDKRSGSDRRSEYHVHTLVVFINDEIYQKQMQSFVSLQEYLREAHGCEMKIFFEGHSDATSVLQWMGEEHEQGFFPEGMFCVAHLRVTNNEWLKSCFEPLRMRSVPAILLKTAEISAPLWFKEYMDEWDRDRSRTFRHARKNAIRLMEDDQIGFGMLQRLIAKHFALLRQADEIQSQVA